MRLDLAGQYDETPYDSRSFPQSHPDRLAVLATLFGLTPAPVSQCRVLELGCATGGNLIPMAATLPGSQFVGIDLSPQQVSMARSECAALALDNIDIQALDILEVDDGLGVFDYIIAHGVYSWVPGPVRDRVLAICARHLAPNGVAYVSYNTYPGWTIRESMRDLMLYFVNGIVEPAPRAAEARAIVRAVADSVSDSAYGPLVRSEVETMKTQSDASLLHDQLEDYNHPVFFHQFIEHAAQHDLQYLAEADFGSMLLWNLPLPQAQAISELTEDPLRLEQYMDLVTHRAFRQTLLCHRSVSMRLPTWEQVACLQVAAPRLVPNATLEVTRAAFERLADMWPQSLSFAELLDQVGGDASALGSSLLVAYGVGAVVFRTQRQPFVVHPGDHPQASRLCRWQAQRLPCVTNQLHENVRVDLIVRALLKLLDGTRDVPQVIEALASQVQAGRLVLERDGHRLKEPDAVRAFFTETVATALPTLARRALLLS